MSVPLAEVGLDREIVAGDVEAAVGFGQRIGIARNRNPIPGNISSQRHRAFAGPGQVHSCSVINKRWLPPLTRRI